MADDEGQVERADHDLECCGDPVTTHDRKETRRTHLPVKIEKKETKDGVYWTCPECGWLLKEFMGVHVDDVA